MVIDTSVVVAVMQEEPGFEGFLEKLANTGSRCISAANYLEAAMVLIERRGELAENELDSFLADGVIAIVPVNVTQVKIARAAFRRFGKGRHPAGLNYGDCFAYSLAVQKAEPLLFKGGDFGLTDVLVA